MKHWETEIFTFGLFNGDLVNVENVENGSKCNCVCPTCETKLIAVKNIIKNKRRPHFRHSKNSNCNFNTYKETVIHYLAKQIIQKKGFISLPITEYKLTEKFGDYYKSEETENGQDTLPIYISKIEKFKTFKFQEIKIEKKKGKVIPDIQLKIEGKNLNVEIAYTHKVGERKKEYLTTQKDDTIEIDLSDIKATSNEQEIENILYGFNLKFKWIFNNKLERQLETKKNEALILRDFLWDKSKLLKLYSNNKQVYNCPLNKQIGQVKFVSVETQCKVCDYFLGIEKDINSEIKKYEKEQDQKEQLEKLQELGIFEEDNLIITFLDDYNLMCSGNLRKELLKKIYGS